MNPQVVWQKTLNKIKEEVSNTNYHGWFSKTEAVGLNDQKITIAVPSAFVAEQLKMRFFSLIDSTLENVLGQKLAIEFKIDPAKFAKTSGEEVSDFTFPQIESAPSASNNLNSKYTLENFVVGLSNNVAYAAAAAVVQNPGISYNPLFVYGGTGMGKTHLMLGVGNALFNKNPGLKVVYCSSEKFMNDYVEAIRNHKMGDLRTRYRSLDLLLIDDVQFFSGREGTQEEFFHTFNELQSKNSQMIITSDRPPHEIAKLEDRLKSRFQGGLMVDIQPPDFDTRVAILRAKCRERGEDLSEEVLKLMASTLETNIRELEGRLMQVLQVLKTQNMAPSLENVASYLQSPKKTAAPLDQKRVIASICNYFDLNLKDLTGPKRQKELVLPRHIAMYILTEEASLTVERVGQILGGRDHTTVMHGRDRIKKLINNDREIQKILIELKQKLLS